MTQASEIPLRVAPVRTVAEEWELVLIAEGLSPRVWPSQDGFIIGVPAEQAERAAAALSAYEIENPIEPPEGSYPTGAGHLGYLLVGITAAGGILAFFFVTGEPDAARPWFQRGSADAYPILLGELWRTVTALTLHADIGHALANAISLGLFLSALCRSIGLGCAAALVLLAGAAGNLANAYFQGPPHISVGASTAVFGAIGLLCSLHTARLHQRKRHRNRFLLPLGAGMALLAMLGTGGGQRIDLWSHLFGFLAGGLLGFSTLPLVLRPPGSLAQWTAGSAALIVITACWALAIWS